MTGAELLRVAYMREHGDSGERVKAVNDMFEHFRPLAELMVAAEGLGPGGGNAKDRVYEAVAAVRMVGVRIQPGWRTEPPSVAEVTVCSTWWMQRAVGAPQLVTLTAMSSSSVHLNGGLFVTDVPDVIRWAPALPPDPPDGSEVRR